MFWGLNLKPNRKYSQTTEKSFHISQAALDGETSQGGAAQIFINVENQRFLICTLRKEVCEQAMLDLNFSAGCKLSFQSVGNGSVSLAGYVIEDDLNDDFMRGDEAESDLESEVEMEEDLRNALNAKKAKKDKVKGKKEQAANDDDDDDEDDDDEEDEEDDDDDDENDSEAEAEENEEDDDEDDDDEEDDEDEDEEDDSEDEEVQQPKAKQPKLEKKEKKQNGVAKNEMPAAANEKKSKADKKEHKKEQQQSQGKNKQQQQQDKPQQKPGQERVLSGGVKVVDLRIGNGPEAKVRKRTQVYYEGRLLSNNKVFDSLKTGAGFKFNLGRGDVIKGWDVGVVGMKVGGKRRITCPSHMAYGARGSPPTIPPNSTLVFEVELKGVN